MTRSAFGSASVGREQIGDRPAASREAPVPARAGEVAGDLEKRRVAVDHGDILDRRPLGDGRPARGAGSGACIEQRARGEIRPAFGDLAEDFGDRGVGRRQPRDEIGKDVVPLRYRRCRPPARAIVIGDGPCAGGQILPRDAVEFCRDRGPQRFGEAPVHRPPDPSSPRQPASSPASALAIRARVSGMP